MATCKRCGEIIEWAQDSNGKWMPKDPGSNGRHQCMDSNRGYSSNQTKTCKYCNQPMKWQNNAGKWVPTNIDGTVHNCRK